MGIQGLLPFVDGATTTVHLSDLHGRRMGVDGYVWLHRGSRSCGMEMVRGMHCDGFVKFCMARVNELIHAGVVPIVVLDGARLPAKECTEVDRQRKRAERRGEAKALLQAGEQHKAVEKYNGAVNIEPEHAYQFILALRKAGVEYMVAPYEADAQLAHLARTGYVDVVRAPPLHGLRPPPCRCPPPRPTLALLPPRRRVRPGALRGL